MLLSRGTFYGKDRCPIPTKHTYFLMVTYFSPFRVTTKSDSEVDNEKNMAT
jgi:hypothetical protein